MSDLIERQAAIDVLNFGVELLKRVLDDAYVVGAEREKYEWGLGLIESYISDMRELPSAQPERKKGHWEDVPHKSVEHGEVIVDGKTVRCSVCRCAEKGWNKGMNYCPECGAKMEVEHEA